MASVFKVALSLDDLMVVGVVYTINLDNYKPN